MPELGQVLVSGSGWSYVGHEKVPGTLAENDLLAGALAMAVIAIVVAGVSPLHPVAARTAERPHFTTWRRGRGQRWEDVRVAGISVGKGSVRSSCGTRMSKVTLDLDDTVRVGQPHAGSR